MPNPSLEKKEIEAKIKTASAEHDFVKKCLQIRRKQLTESKLRPEIEEELREHIQDLENQEKAYSLYITSLIVERRLVEKQRKPTRDYEIHEEKLEKLKKEIRKKFERYKFLQHLEEHLK